MHMSEKVDQIMPEFYRFQQNVKNPIKSAEGLGYKYMTLDNLIDHAREAMAGKGLSFSQEVRSGEDGDIEIMTRIYHISGQWLAFGPLILPRDNGRKMNVIQQSGSAITYGRRYSLAAALGIASEIDSDGTVEEQPPAPEPPIATLRRYYQQDKNGTRALIDSVMAKEGQLGQLPLARQLSLISEIENKNKI